MLCCGVLWCGVSEGIKLLQEEGGLPDVDPFGDLNTELERTLGKIVKEKYGTDFYILHRYPMAVSTKGGGALLGGGVITECVGELVSRLIG